MVVALQRIEQAGVEQVLEEGDDLVVGHLAVLESDNVVYVIHGSEELLRPSP
jgi:hypothetical protein